MAETVGIIAAAAAPAFDAAADFIVSQRNGHHNKELFVRLFLSALRRIEGKLDQVIYAHFKSAKSLLTLWESSAEPLESPMQIHRLEQMLDHATSAWSNLKDIKDRLTALHLMAIANFFIIALTAFREGQGLQWRRGHVEAITVWTTGITQMEELKKVVEIELNPKKRLAGWVFRTRRQDIIVLAASIHDDIMSFTSSELQIQPSKLIQEVNELANRHVLQGHVNSISCCCVFDNGKKAISGSWDETLRVWDLQTGDCIMTLDRSNTQTNQRIGPILCCSVFDNGTKALTGSGDWKAESGQYDLIVWDLLQGREHMRLHGHDASVQCCAVYDNGTKALTGSWDQTLKLWDLTNGTCLHTISDHLGDINCCSVFYDKGRREWMALVGCSNTRAEEHPLQVWSLDTRTPVKALNGQQGDVNCCVVFYDCCWKAISGGQRSMRLWNLHTGQRIATFRGHGGPINACKVFDNGGKALTGSTDNSIRVWDLRQKQNIGVLRGHRDSVYCASLYNDGWSVLSGSADHRLRMWTLRGLF